MPQTLLYLDFDYSEDSEGQGCFDAMADVAPARAAQVEAELAQVLAWAHAQRGWRPAPLDEGGDWDHALGLVLEPGGAVALRFDPATGHVVASLPTLPAPQVRMVYTLTLTGRPTFCAALSEAFGLD